MGRLTLLPHWLTWDGAVLAVLSLSTLILVLDATGLFPFVVAVAQP